MHDGASAWVAKATLVPPRFSEIPPPLVGFGALPLACPFECPLACPFERADGGEVAELDLLHPRSGLHIQSNVLDGGDSAGLGLIARVLGEATGSTVAGAGSAERLVSDDACGASWHPKRVASGAGPETGEPGASPSEPRSISPRPAFSSSVRNREPIHRKM